MAWKERASGSQGGLVFFIIHTVIRFFQFVLALTVLGLYGQDINATRKAGFGADSRWVFAEVVGALAALTALVYMIPLVKSYLAFGWDFVLFILWVAVFGVFGKIYINQDPKGDAGTQRMKNAVWVDLTNMLLWLISALYATAMFFKNRSRRSLHTGRADV